MVGRFVASRLHVTPSLVGCIGQTWDVGRKFSRECDTVHTSPNFGIASSGEQTRSQRPLFPARHHPCGGSSLPQAGRHVLGPNLNCSELGVSGRMRAERAVWVETVGLRQSSDREGR